MVKNFVRRSILAMPMVLAISTTGCGDDPIDEGAPVGITASINGATYSADTSEIFVKGEAPGRYEITARPKNNPDRWLALQLSEVADTGVYPLGVEGGFSSGNALVLDSASKTMWDTPPNGAAGTVHVTTLTPTRIAGTFSFTATPCPKPRCLIANTASGQLQVSNGRFDLPLRAPIPVDTSRRRFKLRLDGTLNGEKIVPIRVDCVVCAATGSSAPPALGFSIITDKVRISVFVLNYTGPGMYQLSQTPNRSINIMLRDPITGVESDSWTTWQPGSSGSIAITKIQDGRITMSFNGTVPSASGKAPATISASMEFSVNAQL